MRLVRDAPGLLGWFPLYLLAGGSGPALDCTFTAVNCVAVCRGLVLIDLCAVMVGAPHKYCLCSGSRLLVQSVFPL
jgi:hypothetical protein